MDSVFIVAELSANHNGDLQTAIDTIKSAAKCGVDAIKLQTYRADTMTIDCDNEYFQIKNGSLWDGEILYSLYEKAHTPWSWHKELFRVAKEEGILCFSSPFDKTAIDFLEGLDNPIYKLASFEIQDIALIDYMASKMKPIIISSGIASVEDIELAIKTIKKYHNEITLLKCTSAYPAKVEDANLKTLLDMKKRFGVEVGLSDHTMGITLPILSVGLGAKVIEKHFILDRSMGGVDSEFSLEPSELKSLVNGVREAQKALGEVKYTLGDDAKSNKIFGRSLFVVEDVKKGDIISEKNIKSIRPGDGMHPKYLNVVLGKTFKQDIKKGTPLKDELIV